MQIKIDLPHFRCPANMAHHLKKVFEGEYDVPVTYGSGQPVILDLGANCGAFAIWATHRWPGCVVHCFEPHPKAFEYLAGNVKPYGNIYAHKYAVGAPGLRPLINGPNNLGESSLHLAANVEEITGEHVEVTDPLSMPRDARILKMDIEGCEFEVLEPLLKDGRRFDAVMFEYHNDSLRKKCWDLLGDYKLTGAHCYNDDLGVLRFVHRELLK